MAASITYLKHAEIDKIRWDACITESCNLIYAKAFYLDAIATDWQALTDKDYNWCFPITHRKKWGIRYIYQPPFLQQLGVFSKPGVKPPYEDIIDYLQQIYPFCESNWNYSTNMELLLSKVSIHSATNFILNLNNTYEAIRANYHSLHLKNIKLSSRSDLQYLPYEDLESVINSYKMHYGTRIAHVKQADYDRFLKLCYVALKRGQIICRQVVNKRGNQLATVLLLKDESRLYNIMNVTTAEGRTVCANHYLWDTLIHEFAGQPVLLDFEGSDLPGVKSFYEKFGAFNQPYFQIKYNRLPRLLRLLKK
ncbi:MAG: hypothetical protein JWP88_1457 [Flaviaesturariibacter sp.]|nr:hypothetical protein [Flaviaesturariibacter sp.]